MMWLPRSRYISAMPLMARLFDSVAPEVKMISLAVAPMSLAICSRAFSTAAFGFPAEAVVAAGGVAEDARQVGHHGLEHARVERRGRVVVHVDGQLDALGKRLVGVCDVQSQRFSHGVCSSYVLFGGRRVPVGGAGVRSFAPDSDKLSISDYSTRTLDSASLLLPLLSVRVMRSRSVRFTTGRQSRGKR